MTTEATRPRRRKRSAASARPREIDPQLHGGASIYDVAERAGVSIVTVSRVFNDYPHVSATMRERVLTAARGVGYTPRLVSKRSLIAVIVGHLDRLSAGDYKVRLMLHLVRVAATRGYLVEFIPYDSVDLATKHLVNGLIEVGLTSDEVHGLTSLPPVPKVAINKADLNGSWSTVCSDHEDEASLAVAHLLDAGHRRIALVLDEEKGWGVEHRRQGYEKLLRARGDASFQPLVLFSSDAPPLEIARRIRDAGCTACVNLTDNFGFAVMDALTNELKLRVPDDLSMICLENASVSPYLSPRLTTVAQPLAEIADQVIGGLVNQLEKGGRRFAVRLKSHLIARDSVRRLA